MVAIRIGISGALGILVTLSLVILMYKLIDSGVKELDEKEGIKIPDFLHVERETTTNAKKTIPFFDSALTQQTSVCDCYLIK